ncbi:hypothetical protein L596_024287 [Steinernema carpocapsae]|uniref:Uncharacterized protein n=1 Tax=Steinernema carpocapsae TaxID=34508 RepID=A0A4U5MGA8_STECR|nr:hypothetical protein L596_024287 [Steinernema carpocapsae]
MSLINVLFGQLFCFSRFIWDSSGIRKSPAFRLVFPLLRFKGNLKQRGTFFLILRCTFGSKRANLRVPLAPIETIISVKLSSSSLARPAFVLSSIHSLIHLSANCPINLVSR